MSFQNQKVSAKGQKKQCSRTVVEYSAFKIYPGEIHLISCVEAIISLISGYNGHLQFSKAKFSKAVFQTCLVRQNPNNKVVKCVL